MTTYVSFKKIRDMAPFPGSQATAPSKGTLTAPYAYVPAGSALIVYSPAGRSCLCGHYLLAPTRARVQLQARPALH